MFSIDSAAYQNLERSRRRLWAQHKTLGGGTVWQYLGAGKESLRLSGTIYPHFRGGLGQIDKLRKLATGSGPIGASGGVFNGVFGQASGLSAPMLAGANGQVFDRHCVVSIQDTQTHFTTSGVPARIDFTLELSRIAGEAP